MNEENGNRGGIKYGELAIANKEKHIFALESLWLSGFFLECNEANFDRISSWKYLFEPIMYKLLKVVMISVQ
jgi:hypothetical protein